MKQTPSSITVINGEYFDILHPERFDFTNDINVIAIALSNICRYTGHVQTFYSVAEHSVLVSRLVPEKYALEGLLHDASEAFVGDVSSPLKKLLPDYQKIENRIQEEIAKQFGLVWPFPKDIHEADKRMYWNERKHISPGVDKIWHQELSAARKVNAVGMSPAMAKRMFLQRFKEIVNGREGYGPLRSERAA